MGAIDDEDGPGHEGNVGWGFDLGQRSLKCCRIERALADYIRASKIHTDLDEPSQGGTIASLRVKTQDVTLLLPGYSIKALLEATLPYRLPPSELFLPFIS